MSCLFYHLSVRSGSRILFQNFSCPRFHFLLGFPCFSLARQYYDRQQGLQ